MPIEVTFSDKSKGTKKSKELTIKIFGDFNFSMDREFREAYFNIVASSYVIDMRDVQYMDSSALGMLINMRKTLGDDSEISICNVNTKIKRILTISRIDKKFIVE